MKRICEVEGLLTEALIFPIQEALSGMNLSFSIGNSVIRGGKILFHFLGFLPFSEERKKVKRLLKLDGTFFLAPSEYHKAMVSDGRRVLFSDYPFDWLEDSEGESDFLELNEIEKPYILTFPHNSTMKELETVFFSFGMVSARYGRDLNLVVVLYNTKRSVYERLLKLAAKCEIIEQLQPIFVERICDVSALIRNANGYIAALFEGAEPYFEAAAALRGIPVAVSPIPPVPEKMHSIAAVAKENTAFALANVFIETTRTIKGDRSEKSRSVRFGDFAAAIRKFLEERK